MVEKKTQSKPKTKAKASSKKSPASNKVEAKKTLETKVDSTNLLFNPKELVKAAYKISPIGTIFAATIVTILVLHAACYIIF